MEADTAQRYRSRILREMSANRANPFNSPPSSTGSHGTVSPTVSSIFSGPDGESTRRLHEDIARVTASRKLPVNWDAAHRKWPDFFSKPKTRDAPLAVGDIDDLDKLALDARSSRCRENKQPVESVQFVDDSTQEIWPGAAKTRAEMQPRVDNESDLSDTISKPPAPSLAQRTSAKITRTQSSLAENIRITTSSDHASQRRPSISKALDRLRRASSSPPSEGEHRRQPGSPPLSSAKSSMTAVPPSPNSSNSFADAQGNSTSHAPSFFMPDVSHLGDFVTGTLKFSGSMKNGVPIFVKNGRVHDRRERPAAGAHAEVDGIQVPEVEDKIFVSMDMIRGEIMSLQEHHDKVQEYAENLQHHVDRLEAQLKSKKGFCNHASFHEPSEKLHARNHGKTIPDCRVAFRSTAKHCAELDMQVTTLQSQLEKTQRKVSDSEMENISLAHERDRAVNRLQSACEDISKLTRKLNVKENELESSHKQVADQMRHDNHTLRQDLMSIKQGRDALERENASLRAENEMLRKQAKKLREEIKVLRDNLDAAREELETQQQQTERGHQALLADHEDDVQQLIKYESEWMKQCEEKSKLERTVRKLEKDIDYLKQQLDHCRPLPKDDFSARLDEETEENMTSAFFVPDITINTNESGPADPTETREMPALAELTSKSHKTTTCRNDTRQETREVTRREVTQASKSKNSKNAVAKHAVQQGQKVAFSMPEKETPSKKPVANKGSKRRNLIKGASEHAVDFFQDMDDTTGPQSVENTTQDRATVSLNLSTKNHTHHQSRPRDTTSQTTKVQRAQQDSTRTTQKLVLETDAGTQSSKQAVDTGSACPALSIDARRILDGLCEHKCRNCIVCSRITSHRGVVTSAEVAVGKKRVTVSRPVPVTDRETSDENATVRPSQSPGHALALVIKGLEDEGQHLQLELSHLQARYNSSDKSLGRGERLSLAEGIRTLLKRLEVKNDQIYSLFDVLEGQKAAGQAMSEEEVEMTVLNITGMTVRDVTSGSEQFTWEWI